LPLAATDGAVYLLTRTGAVWRLGPGADEPVELAAFHRAAGASLTLADDRILVGFLDGTLILLQLDGDIIWRKNMGRSIYAPVTVNQGAIYVPLRDGTVVKLVDPQ
jgi:outer membrane protein assembly factor BamB